MAIVVILSKHGVLFGKTYILSDSEIYKKEIKKNQQDKNECSCKKAIQFPVTEDLESQAVFLSGAGNMVGVARCKTSSALKATNWKGSSKLWGHH